MAKSKKSKILASMLAVSTMAVFYVAPVMAAELYENASNRVTTNGGTKITELEGLKEITLGNSVKITTDGKGIIRVGDVNGVNTRVHNDGFYINKTGHDQKTSLTAGTLTLAGKELTSRQLVNINTVIGENGVITAANGSTVGGVRMNAGRVSGNGFFVRGSDNALDTTGLKLGDEYLDETKLGAINDVITNDGAVESKGDVTSKADGTTTYSLNTVGANTSGITRDIEGKVTTIEGAFSVDKKGHIYNANRSFQVTKDGAARFGARSGVNVRMENGVLSINSEGTNAVASLSKDGLMLSDFVNGQQTLTAAKIADIQHIKHVGNATVIEQNTAISADGIVVKDPGSGVSTKTKYDGFYVKDKDSKIVSSLEDDGLKLTDQESGKRHTLNATDIADIKGIDRVDTNNDGKLDTTVIEKTLAVSETGIAMSKGDMQLAVNEAGFAAVKGENAIYLNENGVNLSAGNDNFVSVTQDGIGLQGGTSQVIMNSNNGAVFRNGDKAVNGETVINGGSITTNRITTGTVNGVAIGMNGDGDITLGNNVVIDGDFNSDNIAGITRVERNDSAPGSEVTYIEKNTAVSADGIVVTDQDTGVSTKTKYDGFYVKDKTGKNVSRLTKDRLELAGKNLAVADSEGNIDVSASTYTAGDATAENVRVKSDGIYVKKGSEILNSLTAEGLTLGKQQLTEEKIADIGGIDRSYDEETISYTTTIEKALSISDDGSFATTNGNFSVDAEGNLYSTNGTVTVQTRENLAAVQLGQTTLGMSDEDITMSVGRGTAIALSKYTGINLSSGGNNIALNSDGAVFTNDNIEGSTVIKGGSVTTGTITADDLHVDNIYLGNQIVDEEGNVVGSDLAIGADGSIKIADNFEVDTDNLAAHYVGEDDEYELTLDGNGFALGNSQASLTLTDKGYAFRGPVNLGAGSDVKYTGGNYDTLAKLDATVKDIYDRTDGIYKDSEGNTVISKEEGTWNGTKTVYEGEGSKVVVGDNGTTFVNGESNGTTNIDGSKITSDADGTISGGSGPSTNNIGNPVGSSTTNGEETVYDGENGNTNTVNSSGMTVTNRENGNTNTNTVNSSGMTVTNSTSTTVIDAEKVDTTTGNFSNKVTVGIQGNQTVITGGDISVDNSVTVAGGSENKTTINNEGITVGDKGTSIKNDSISVGDGGYIGDGDVRSGEGVSLNDTAERVGHLENRVGKLEDRVDKVGAMAAAIANLRTMGYDPAAPTEVAVGIGQYRDETGAALGLFHYPNRDFMLSLSVSTSGDEVMGGIGATWKFGRKSPEKVAEIKKAQAEADARRAEEAKLAKAEEMKQAAKEAKIKAQQERHAKLAAERAAQAEAAK